MCPKRTSWLRSCGGLGMGGACGGPERREGDGVGCIVIDMALGCGIPLGRPKPLPSFFINTMILLEHRTGRCRSWTN
jgi:hypothetical protein